MINLNEKQYMRLQTLFLCAFLFSFLLAWIPQQNLAGGFCRCRTGGENDE